MTEIPEDKKAAATCLESIGLEADKYRTGNTKVHTNCLPPSLPPSWEIPKEISKQNCFYDSQPSHLEKKSLPWS